MKPAGRQDLLERGHRLPSEGAHGRGTLGDRATRYPELEPDLGFRLVGRRSGVVESEAKRHRPTPPGRQSRGRQRAQLAQGRRGVTELSQRHEVDDESDIAREAPGRLIEIRVDAHEVRPGRRVKEEIGAPRRLAVPPTLELMAGRFLQSRQLPADLFDALLNRIDERLEREKAAGNEPLGTFARRVLKRFLARRRK